MQPFPPPSPDDLQPAPLQQRPNSRRRIAFAAAAAAALGVGGVVVGAQLVSADDTTSEAGTDEIGTDEPTADEPTDDEATTDTTDEEPATIDGAETDADSNGDENETPIDDEPGDLGSLFDDITSCLTDELPDDFFGGDFLDDFLGGDVVPEDDVIESDGFPADGEWDEAFDEFFGGSVTVVGSGDDLLQFFDFGDDDGSITITKTDGEIEVSTDGDVDQIEIPEFDVSAIDVAEFEIPEFDPEAGDAIVECLPSLGDGALDDILGDLLDDQFAD